MYRLPGRWRSDARSAFVHVICDTSFTTLKEENGIASYIYMYRDFRSAIFVFFFFLLFFINSFYYFFCFLPFSSTCVLLRETTYTDNYDFVGVTTASSLHAGNDFPDTLQLAMHAHTHIRGITHRAYVTPSYTRAKLVFIFMECLIKGILFLIARIETTRRGHKGSWNLHSNCPNIEFEALELTRIDEWLCQIPLECLTAM